MEDNLKASFDSLLDTSKSYKNFHEVMLTEFKKIKREGNDLGEVHWTGQAADRFNNLFNNWSSIAENVLRELEGNGIRLEVNAIDYSNTEQSSGDKINKTLEENPVLNPSWKLNL